MKKAIVTDMVLEEVEALFERRVVTPSTLFAANSLAQAVILHDEVCLGMVRSAGALLSGGEFVEAQFLDLHLGADSPRRPQVAEPNFEIEDSSPYSSAPITYWLAPESFVSNTSVETELAHLEVVLDFLRARQLTDITGDDALLDNFGVHGGRRVNLVDECKFNEFNKDVLKAGGKVLTPNDLTTVRDLAWLAAAGLTVAWARKYEVYHALLERPLYAGQLPRPGGPLELVEKMAEENQAVDFWAGEIGLPPFFGMIISDRHFSVQDFWSLLWQMRDRHEEFRISVGGFEASIYGAATQRELKSILAEYRSSWDALLTQKNYKTEHRLLYTVADAVASNGKSLMKELIEANRAERKILHTGGLVRLWDDMEAITPATRAPELLQRHFGSVPDDRTWTNVHALVKKVNSAAGIRGGFL